MLDNTPNQPSTIKCQVYVIMSMHILLKETITVVNITTATTAANNTAKKVIFKYSALFTDFISSLNNTQVDDAHNIDVVMLMYNLNVYSYNHSKTSRILWQYCKL